MHNAAWNNSVSVLKILTAKGAAIDAKDKNGLTPLVYASMQGHEEAVFLLLKTGADMNSTSIHNQTCLHWAAVRNHLEVAKILLAAGVDPPT